MAYANRRLETIPGEKVLRDSKEERNQRNRLQEIDQQLKNLEGTVSLPNFSVLLKTVLFCTKKKK